MNRKAPGYRAITVSLLAVLLMTTVCASAEVSLPTKYEPLSIARRVAPRKGTVAWSPDSTKIAYISAGLHIYNIPAKDDQPVRVASPYYVSWEGSSDPAVLYLDEGKKTLGLIDSNKLSVRKLPLEAGPDAVFAIENGRKLLLFSLDITPRALWTDYRYSLAVYDGRTGDTKTILESGKGLPIKKAGKEDLSGLVQPEINPADTSVLILEFVRPPNAPSYLGALTVDYITGKTVELGRIDHGKHSVPASWSPDGTAFAFADDEGRLRTFPADALPPETGAGITGSRPSWDRVSGRIFFGGYIIDPKGKSKERLLQDSPSVMAEWSPDGNMLALITEGELWVLGNLGQSPDALREAPDRRQLDKKVMLKELLSEGLITEEDYEAGIKRITGQGGDTR